MLMFSRKPRLVLDFIGDDKIRQFIANYADDAYRCFAYGLFRPTCFSAGAAMEALLSYAVSLYRRESTSRMGLDKLIATAQELSIVPRADVALLTFIRQYRNTIHINVMQVTDVTKDNAKMALDGLTYLTNTIGGKLQSYMEREVSAILKGENGFTSVRKTPFRIGRDSEGDLVLSHSKVSRCHAEIVYTGGEFYIRDLGSRNGTSLQLPGGEKQSLEVNEKYQLQQEAKIWIGPEQQLQFMLEDGTM